MGAEWKREKVQDHKFDFINVDDFVDNSCWRQFTYMMVFAAIIRGILIYCSDIFTAVNMLTNSNINGTLFTSAKDGGIELGVAHLKLPLDVYKYLFTGCIVLGFLLLALEIRRASAIVKSRDISYAFTSMIASRYYTVRSYPHYCFFAQINNSKKHVDDIAFFCFFKFRNWKRLILADAPRQVINATILYQTFRGHFYFEKNGSPKGNLFDWDSIIDETDKDVRLFKQIALGAMIFTVFMFAMSLIMLLTAVVVYIPLVSHIQGNLKEYCCHKIDKRIDELIRKKSKSRAAEAAGKGDIALGNMKQPTLPQLDLLEAPPAGTPRNDYASAHTPHQKHRQAYNQQPDYGYSPGSYSTHSTQPLVQNQGYNQYATDDYYQSPSSKSTKKPDPYADQAYTTDDVYDSYGSGTQEQSVYGGQQTRGYYNASTPGSGQTPSRPPRRFDEHPQRPGSPMQSQHGSDLDSHHSSSGPGGYGGSNSGYGNNARYGGGNYGHGYQSNPRRQETGQSRDRYGGDGRGGY
ncbi:hypothetical protein BGZ81_011742 [Podila clonocystis]|nr:hypothetical protein BGZ81_011742 [Podila clonocystis]